MILKKNEDASQIKKWEALKIELHDHSFHQFGYSYIFQRRGRRLKRITNTISVLGVIIPVLIGGIVVNFGINSNLLAIIIPLTGIIGLIQLSLSTVSIILGWSDGLFYSIESAHDHERLHSKYKILAKFPPEDYQILKVEFSELEKERLFRDHQDSKVHISDKEKRIGMRAALREYKKECVGCKKIPLSMKDSDCDVCGKFTLKYILWKRK